MVCRLLVTNSSGYFTLRICIGFNLEYVSNVIRRSKFGGRSLIIKKNYILSKTIELLNCLNTFDKFWKVSVCDVSVASECLTDSLFTCSRMALVSGLYCT